MSKLPSSNIDDKLLKLLHQNMQEVKRSALCFSAAIRQALPMPDPNAEALINSLEHFDPVDFDQFTLGITEIDKSFKGLLQHQSEEKPFGCAFDQEHFPKMMDDAALFMNSIGDYFEAASKATEGLV